MLTLMASAGFAIVSSRSNSRAIMSTSTRLSPKQKRGKVTCVDDDANTMTDSLGDFCWCTDPTELGAAGIMPNHLLDHQNNVHGGTSVTPNHGTIDFDSMPESYGVIDRSTMACLVFTRTPINSASP